MTEVEMRRHQASYNTISSLILFFLLIPMVSKADVYGFKPVEGKVQKGSEVEVKNLPPPMSQDTLGICWSFVASQLLTAENCRYEKEDCRQVSPDKIISPVGLGPYRSEAAGKKSNGQKDKKKNKQNQKNMTEQEKALEQVNSLSPGNSVNVINDIIDIGLAPSEGCVSLDKILSKIGGAQEASEMQLNAWLKLEKLYEDYKKIKADCLKCQTDFYATANDEISKDFGVQLPQDKMLKAFGAETFGKFFDRVFLPIECRKPANMVPLDWTESVKFSYYPEKGKFGTYQKSIESIKQAVTNGRPVGLGQLCLDKSPEDPKDPKSSECINMHGVVIAGYRKVCKAKGDCRDSVKIINSWGKTWQEQNNGGWVDAQTLLDRTFYQEGTLSWFEDKK